MKKIRTAGLLAMTITVGGISHAHAAIVNLDAVAHTISSPLVLTLDPGTYTVTPIGVADGGAYNAWSAWNDPDRWVNNYSLSSSEFEAYTMQDGVEYTTDTMALANALSTSFTLTSTTDVNFYIWDSYYLDNLGGISLNISSVPVPAAAWLFGSGLIGLIGVARRSRARI